MTSQIVSSGIQMSPGPSQTFANVTPLTVANVPMAASVVNIPLSSTILSPSSQQIASQLELTSFADTPTRNEGFDTYRFRINRMKIQKV